MSEQQTIAGQVTLVTGASRGIGAAIADRLAGEGARVFGTATTQAGADAITERLSAKGGAGLVLDVGVSGAIEAVIEHINSEAGAVTILVNNAGMARDQLLLRMKDEDWQNVLDVNLGAIYRASKAVLRGMLKARSGRIISIGSVIGSMGNAGQANYAAAKAGMIGFSKSLAREVGSRGITVNVVAPGFIETDMTGGIGEAQRDAMLASVPLGRLGSAEDIAHAVAFLAGPGGAYITGETLNVNGGMLMS